MKRTQKSTAVVLVVDDEPEIVRLVKSALQSDGYTVYGATTPAGALQRAKRLKGVQLLIANLHLPTMNGVQLARRISTLSAEPPKILFITGNPDHPLLERLAENNEMCLLRKPFTQAELLIKVRTVLEAEPCIFPFFPYAAD